MESPLPPGRIDEVRAEAERTIRVLLATSDPLRALVWVVLPAFLPFVGTAITMWAVSRSKRAIRAP
jgi:hypothetical protein